MRVYNRGFILFFLLFSVRSYAECLVYDIPASIYKPKGGGSGTYPFELDLSAQASDFEGKWIVSDPYQKICIRQSRADTDAYVLKVQSDNSEFRGLGYLRSPQEGMMEGVLESVPDFQYVKVMKLNTEGRRDQFLFWREIPGRNGACRRVIIRELIRLPLIDNEGSRDARCRSTR